MKCPACNFTWDRFDDCETLPIHDCGKFREAAILGVGDHLHELVFRWFGEDFVENCGCRFYVAKMNAWGVEGCRRRMDRNARHLLGGAHRRGLMDSKTAIMQWVKGIGAKAVCRRLVKRTIQRAEKVKALLSDEG
jgi:hypothetical protein